MNKGDRRDMYMHNSHINLMDQKEKNKKAGKEETYKT